MCVSGNSVSYARLIADWDNHAATCSKRLPLAFEKALDLPAAPMKCRIPHQVQWAPRHVGMDMHRKLLIGNCLVEKTHGDGLMIPCTSHLP